MKMSRRTNKSLVEPPAVMLTDLAFNLVIFFVVCASTEPETGRKQQMPSSRKEESAATQMAKNLEVTLSKSEKNVLINGDPTPMVDFSSRIRKMLAGKTRPEDRIVVVKTQAPKDAPYSHWIRVTSLIEQAGGLVALQVEEGKEITVK